MLVGGGSAPWYILVALLAIYLAIFGSILAVGFNIVLNLYRLTVPEQRTQRTYRKLAFFCGIPVVVAMILVVANWGKLEGANQIQAYRSASVLAEEHFGEETVKNGGCQTSSVLIERSPDPNLVTMKSGETVEWHEFVALETKRLEEDGWTVERRVSTPRYDQRALWGFRAQRDDDTIRLYTVTSGITFGSVACLDDEETRTTEIRGVALPPAEVTVATYPEVVGLEARQTAWTSGVGGAALGNYQLLSGYLGGSSRWQGNTVTFGVGRPEPCASHTVSRRHFDRPQAQSFTESLEVVLRSLEADGWLVSRQVHKSRYSDPKAIAARDDVVLIVTVGVGTSQAIWLPSECVDWSNRTLLDYVEVPAFDT